MPPRDLTTLPTLDPVEDISRRELLAAIPAFALLAAGISCGDDDDSEPPVTAWSFTDDRGERIERPSRPVRIIAQEDSAAALWSFGIRPVGVFGNAPLADNPQFTAAEIADVEVVGAEFGVIDIEKILALEPDLIVTTYWPTQGSAGGGFADDAQEARVAEAAPIAYITADLPFRAMMERYAGLAEALGADFGAGDVVDEQKQLDDALDRLAAAIAAKPGLRAVPISGSADSLYIAAAAGFSDLREYAGAGLAFVDPGNTADFGGLWSNPSWEQFRDYQADIVLYDDRAPGGNDEVLAEVATWRAHPAVAAGQICPWFVGTTYRLSFFTTHVEQLVAVIERARTLA